jgi:predicted ATP-grasp superfamily ATP-dependent carboligase
MNQTPLSEDSSFKKTLVIKIDPAAPKTPVVIVGADADGLGLARCLREANVPIVVCDTDARRPGMHSRYVRPFVLGAMHGPRLIEGLLALRERLDVSPLLFLTSDLQVRTVSEDRDRLKGAYKIPLPERDCIRQLLHKVSFQLFAEKHGFRVPPAIGVSRESDLAKLAALRFPAVIKPGNKELFFGNRAPRALKVQSRQEAENVCRSLLPEAADLIVQEWVEGGEDDIFFCLQYRGRDGLTVRSFTGRKLRCWPPQTGSTASCTAAPEVQSSLGRVSEEFAARANLVGLWSMEFKRHSNSGEFFMIEPTVGRVDWQEEVAAMNGVNIPLAAYRHEIGPPVADSLTTRQPLRAWIYPPSYVRSVLCSRSFPEATWRNLRAQSPCWNFADPLPSAYFLLEWTRKLCSPLRWRELLLERRQNRSTAAPKPSPERTQAETEVLPATSVPPGP